LRGSAEAGVIGYWLIVIGLRVGASIFGKLGRSVNSVYYKRSSFCMKYAI
jgi:hypothetical protein